MVHRGCAWDCVQKNTIRVKPSSNLLVRWELEKVRTVRIEFIELSRMFMHVHVCALECFTLPMKSICVSGNGKLIQKKMILNVHHYNNEWLPDWKTAVKTWNFKPVRLNCRCILCALFTIHPSRQIQIFRSTIYWEKILIAVPFCILSFSFHSISFFFSSSIEQWNICCLQNFANFSFVCIYVSLLTNAHFILYN